MGTITRSHSFVAGEKPTDDQWNVDIDQLFTLGNGNLDEGNVDYSSSDGIVTMQQTQTITGTKTFDAAVTFNTSVLPDAAGGADMGSATQEWGNVYVADDKFINFGSDQNVLVGYDETTTDSLKIAATEAAGLAITLMADEGDDAGDEWKLNVADGGVITLGNDIASAGSYVTQLTLTPNSTVASSTTAIAGHATIGGNATVTGVLKTDSGTDATSTTDGSLQTDGGLSVAKDAILGNDVKLLTDSSVLSLGVGSDATLTHDGTTGVTIAANPITVDSGDALTLDAHTGIFVFKDAGSEVLRFTEGNSGDVTIKLETNGKDLVFTDNGDATNMKILDAAAGINVPGEVQTTKIAYTDGDDALTIADGGGVTTSSTLAIGSVVNADTDTNKFLVLDGSGNVDFRTGAEVASDIGAATGATAADDIGTGDAAVSLATTTGNITIDAQANDADVIIKVDDGGSAVTAVTFDGSDEGNAIFVNDVQLKSDSALLEFGADLDTTLTHTDGTGLTLNSTNKLTFGDVASFIQQSADGTLRIDGEAIIDLNASTRVDVSGDLKVGGEVQTASIGYTDGDNSMTIADGGGVTFAQAVDLGSNTLTSTGSLQVRTIDYSDGDNAITIADGGSSTFAQNTFVADGSGLIIGHTAPFTTDTACELQYLGTANADTRALFGRFSNSAVGGQLQFLKSRNATVRNDAFTVVQDDDQVGRIVGYADDGTNYGSVTSIISLDIDGDCSENDTPGRITFHTTADTEQSATERMRIDSAGNVLVGKTAAGIGTAGLEIDSNGVIGSTRAGNYSIKVNRITNLDLDGKLVSFRYNNVEKGSVRTDGTNVSYATSSDYRLKENIVDLTGAVTRVKSLQPRRFNFKEAPDVTKDGFIAHEASTVVPEAVSGTKDATETLSNVVVDADGNVLDEDRTEAAWTSGKEPELISAATDEAEAVYGDPIYAADTVWHETLTVPDYQGIDQAKLVPLLTAAIQELTARIEVLESA